MEKKIKFIDSEQPIDIKIGSGYYTDLKFMFMDILTKDESKESIGVIMDNLTKGTATTAKEFYLIMLFKLIREIETVAVEKGYVIEKSVDAIQKDSSQDSSQEIN